MPMHSNHKRSAGLARILYVVFVVALPTAWMTYSLASHQAWLRMLPPAVLSH